MAQSTNFNKRVGAQLKRIRQAAGWSQSDLANQLIPLGISFAQQTVLKIEQGSRPLKFEEACAIAEVLGVSVEALTQYVDDRGSG